MTMMSLLVHSQDAFIDQEIKNYIRQCGETYLEESNLNTLVSKMSQIRTYVIYNIAFVHKGLLMNS